MTVVLYLYFCAFIFGCMAGSFSNVCILRMPAGKSVVLPPSHCPVCKNSIAWHDNIPVVSWFLLMGKCRSCETPISGIYPAVEFISGLIYIVTFNRWGMTGQFFLFSLLCSSFLVITVIDYRHKIIPDLITLPGIAAGLLSSVVIGQVAFTDSLTGFFLGGGLFFMIALLSNGGMGGGDIKLMGMIGAFLGWKAVLLTTFAGSLSGSLAGIGLMLAGKKGRKDQIPFGPFLVFGATLSLFFESDILEWYFSFSSGLFMR